MNKSVQAPRWWIGLAVVALIAAGAVVAAPPTTARTPMPVASPQRSLPAEPGQGTDFDGDGIDDILWDAPASGADYLWSGRSNGFSSRSVSAPGAGVSIVGDFNGDGRHDVLWYGAGAAADHMWYGTSSGFRSRAVTIGGSYEPVVGDFDGNGTDDILWYTPGSGSDYLWYGSPTGVSSRAVTVSGSYRRVVGDFDGNGADDILWYAPGAGGDYLWSGRPSRGFSETAVTVGGSYVPLVGDFDGNNVDDIFWYAPGAGGDYLWLGRTSGGKRVVPVGVGGSYRPLIGNFDGVGGDDILWFAPGATQDYLWRWSGGRFHSSAKTVGGTYEPVIGDFDGDGRTDILWYEAGPGADYLWHSGPNFRSIPQTINGVYTPVPPDVGVVASPGTARYAVADGRLSLHLPSPSTHYIGFHQASSSTGVTQSSASMPVRWSVLPSRSRGTGGRTAADVVLPPGADVLAPVTGVVVEARGYWLYGLYTDSMVAIAPSGYGGEVLVLHLSGLRVRPGDSVVAGVTPIANTARRLPFASQVDLPSGQPTWPHAHIEVSSVGGVRAPHVFG